MDLNKLRVSDPSGIFSREKYVMNNYPEEYDYIISYCKDNNLDMSFKEKVYCVLNDISIIQLCKNSKCNNKVKYRNKITGYNDYCSNKCQSTCTHIIEKKKQTNIEKYGTEHAIFNKEINDKFRDSIKKTDSEKKAINKKRKNTVNEKYGVESVAQVKEIQEKRIESFKKNSTWYENFTKTNKDYFDSFYVKYKHVNIKSITRDNKNKNKDSCVLNITCEKSHNYNINYPLFFYRNKNKHILCTKCNPIDNKTSSFHLDIVDFIKSIYDGEILINDREVISPLEIDIYLPELKIGIECNGLYWHSEKYRGKTYHRDKYLDCKKNDIKLIQIYDDDWNYKTDIIKSRISNQLGLIENKIFARKTIIKEVTNIESRNFLIDNHLQGFVGSKVKIGLYHEDVLVSLMTFGKPRKALNSISSNEDDWELLRFCNSRNVSVIGGASKLFNYFINNYKNNKITSYSMLEWGDGEYYSKLGFENSGMTEVGYYYIINGIKKHRFQFQKQKLIKEGYDKNKTEYQIMLDRGYDRIWTVGNMRWVYKNKKRIL